MLKRWVLLRLGMDYRCGCRAYTPHSIFLIAPIWLSLFAFNLSVCTWFHVETVSTIASRFGVSWCPSILTVSFLFDPMLIERLMSSQLVYILRAPGYELHVSSCFVMHSLSYNVCAYCCIHRSPVVMLLLARWCVACPFTPTRNRYIANRYTCRCNGYMM